jgi:hypothetical protein
MDSARLVIRLEMQGSWTAEDAGICFTNMSKLYEIGLFVALLNEDKSFAMHYKIPYDHIGIDKKFELFASGISASKKLTVGKMRYASPGAIDLVGIGAVVGHLKDFVLKMVERSDLRVERKLNEQRLLLENQRLEIENARQFISLAREVGLSEIELRGIADLTRETGKGISQLIEQGKLTKVAVLDDAGGSRNK